MPILRHECPTCEVEVTDLYPQHAPTPECGCGRPMRLLMPKRVVGRVVPDSNGVHSGSGFSPPQSAAVYDPTVPLVLGDEFHDPARLEAFQAERPTSRVVSTEIDTDNPNVVPLPSATGVFAKDYEDCTAAERDERWMDGAQALEAWTTKQLEAKGEAPAVARSMAATAAQDSITTSRAESSRDDGLS